MQKNVGVSKGLGKQDHHERKKKKDHKAWTLKHTIAKRNQRARKRLAAAAAAPPGRSSAYVTTASPQTRRGWPTARGDMPRASEGGGRRRDNTGDDGLVLREVLAGGRLLREARPVWLSFLGGRREGKRRFELFLGGRRGGRFASFPLDPAEENATPQSHLRELSSMYFLGHGTAL